MDFLNGFLIGVSAIAVVLILIVVFGWLADLEERVSKLEKKNKGGEGDSQI